MTEASKEPKERSVYQKLSTALSKHAGTDFGQYNETLLRHQVEHRMGLLGLQILEEYVDFLIKNNEEKDKLCQAVLIGVTQFFRDRDAYESLYHTVFEPFARSGSRIFRIWSIACSTGEEAYSLAILACECMERFHVDREIQIFATDVDRFAVDTAKAAFYSSEDTALIASDILEKYFDRREDGYLIKEYVRRMVVFAKHDILQDAPFSHIDLAVCRNVFIYFRQEMQYQALLKIYWALNENGALFLGSSESLGDMEKAFEPLNPKWRIYRRNSSGADSFTKSYLAQYNYCEGMHTGTGRSWKYRIDEAGQETGRQEITEQGKAQAEENQIWDDGSQELFSAEMTDREASDNFEPIGEDRIVERVMESLTRSAVLVNESGEVLRLVRGDTREDTENTKEAETGTVYRLQQELEDTNRKLQSVVRELGSKNVQLHTMNEQVIISNEELQSANEELHAVNEELFRLNDDYQVKIRELTKANADFDNLLMNAEIGALYIDNELNIRKITPIMERNTNLLPADLGRPVSHVRFMEEYQDLEMDVRNCQELGCSIEREIKKEGVTWLLRIRPYYVGKSVDGVLVTLFDITKRLEAAKFELQLLNNSIPGGVSTMRYENGLVIEYANDSLYRMMNMTREDFYERYRNHYEAVMYDEDWQKLQKLIDRSIQSKKTVQLEYRVRVNEHDDEWRLMQASILEKRGNRPILQCVITDITAPKNIQLQLDSLINHSPAGTMRLAYDGESLRVEYVSIQMEKIIGYSRAKVADTIEKNFFKNRVEATGANPVYREFDRMLEGADMMEQQYCFRRKSGEDVWLEIRGAVVARYQQKVIIQLIINDITESRLNDLALEEQRKKLSAVVEMSGDMIFEYDIKEDKMGYARSGEGILHPVQITENYARTVQSNSIFEEQADGVKLCNELRSGAENIYAQLRRLGTDKNFHWIEVVGKTIYDKKGKPLRVLGKFRNIDDQKNREAELLEKSRKDSLTGLLNQMTVKKEIMKKLSSWKEGDLAYLIVCDIDDFKRLNDCNGHLFGDAVLCSFADELSNLFPESLKGRIGGDEFIIYVENAGREILEKWLNALNRAMTDRFQDDQLRFAITCSLGVVVVDGTLTDYGSLFAWADSALYQVKSEGKGKYLITAPGTGEAPGKRYLSGGHKKDEYVREEALISIGDDLVIFSLELLESVEDLTGALKMICDRTCRFYDMDDMICVEHMPDMNRIIYQWSRVEKQDFIRDMLSRDHYNFDRICEKADDKGTLQMIGYGSFNQVEKGSGSVLITVPVEHRDYSASIIFVDRVKGRDWKAQKDTLVRLSGQIFAKLRQVRMEEKERFELDHRLNYDKLTGLPLYERFKQQCEEYLKENSSGQLSFVASDFSHFQYINDMYGYEEGDHVLKELARAFMEECPGSVLFCRVTSDHFVGLIKGGSPEEMAVRYRHFTEKFCMQIHERYENCNPVLSSGLYAVKGIEKVSSMIDKANEARKKSKEQKGFPDVIVYNEQLRKQNESSRTITANMLSAYHNGEFHAWLQPKVSLDRGRIVGAEALVRWIRPDGELIMPDQFIDIFEKNYFITKVDFCVLDQVMAYLQEAITLGEEVVPVSVNFSRHHNEFKQFIPSIMKRLESFCVPASLLEAEITESVFMSDLTKLKENIALLQKAGVQIAIDDFGSGYSSLNVLTKVSADVIKLDKQFLQDNSDITRSLTFVKYLIRMLKRMGYRVIAEGVETAEQVELLKNADCDMAQGYYYARPMPIEDFRKFLKEYNGRQSHRD